MAKGKFFKTRFSPSSLLRAYLESLASLIPSADKCIKCFKLYSLQSFANNDGKVVWMFENVFPFFFSYKIPTKLMQILALMKKIYSLIKKKSLILEKQI